MINIFSYVADINSCKCEEENKIPQSRVKFFQSNLFNRGSESILTIDSLPTLLLEETRQSIEQDLPSEVEDENDPIEDINDRDYEPDEKLRKKSEPIRNRFDYPSAISSIRRCQDSYETGFQILNSFLLDLKTHAPSQEIQKFLNSHFLCKTKVAQMTRRFGLLRAEKHLEYLKSDPKKVLGVDGKKSDVRQQHGRLKTEDKQVVIGEKHVIDFFSIKAHYL